jgi:PAS domain S-box-containing protein
MKGDQMFIQEDYFKNIFNTVREAILILDENMRVLSANRSFFTTFKVDSATTIGSLLYDLGNGQWNIPYLRVLLEDVLPKNDTVDDYKIEHTFESIGQKTMLLNACKIREKNNDLPIILLAIEDITERREIEKGLEKYRQELEVTKISEVEDREYAESIINTVREPLIALDQDLRVVSASRSFYDFFKVKPEETVGQLIYDLGNKQWDIPLLRELLETILPQKTTFDNYEVEHNFATIGRRIMLLNARQIKRGRGKERIILLAIEDITERKEIETGLENTRKELVVIKKSADEAHEFAESVINTVREPLIAMDQDLRVVSASRSFYDFFKVKPEETVGQLIYDLGNKQWDIPLLRELLETILPQKTTFDNYEVEHNFATIGRRIMLLNARQIKRGKGKERIILLAIEDITERKRLEDMLTESELRYRRIFETASDGIVLLEKQEGHIVKANPAAEKLLGYSKEEYTGKKLQDIGVSLDMSDFPRIMQNLDKSGILNYDNVVVKTRSGQYINTDIYMVDRAKLAQCNIRDVSERRRALDALRESQQILERIINAMPVRVFWKDKNLFYLGCNTAFARDAGFAHSKDIIGKDDYQMGWREQAELYRSDDRQVIESGGSKFLIEEPQTTAEGNTITLLTSKMPLLSSHGEIIGVLGTYMDITELKNAEQALLSSEKKYRDLLETINLIAVMLDHDGNITFCNDYFLHLTGRTRDEVLNRCWFDLFLPADIREATRSMFTFGIAEGTIPAHYESVIITRDGDKINIEWNHSLLRDKKGKVIGVASIGNDITEHRKLEAQLRHAQKMEAVGTLAGGIAHDFNNILNVIIGYGTMVMDKLEAGSPSKEQMNEVLNAADRAANLTKRLLVFSRKQVVEVKPININELIIGLQKMLVRIISESIDFNLNLAGRPLIVLANLVANAKDAMQESGRLTIGTGLEEVDDEYVAAYGYGKPGRYALITVSDTGQGMDAEIRKKIFEPFFTTKGIGEGTGLGLAISYGIIKQHSGYIKVYSEPGQGTVFKIYLPLAEEAASPDKKTQAAVPVKGGNETILVAEDDASLRNLARIVLESFGYTVISAEDGVDAIAKFMENRDRINLVLLDMIMPKKNGKEVSEAIRKVSPRIKILFVSGYTMDIIKTKELTEAGFDFIHKPFLPKDLLIKMREVLDK